MPRKMPARRISSSANCRGVLDLDDDEVEIDLEQVADAVCKKAKKEGQGDYKADEVFFVVQADLDYQEQTL